jgi:hypothetical protein
MGTQWLLPPFSPAMLRATHSPSPVVKTRVPSGVAGSNPLARQPARVAQWQSNPLATIPRRRLATTNDDVDFANDRRLKSDD